MLHVDLIVEWSPACVDANSCCCSDLGFLLLFKMSEMVICCSSEVRLYGRTPSVLRWPFRSIMSCSSMPDE